MTKPVSSVIEWLLSGDIAVRYQTTRDLLDDNQPRLQNRITQEGWGRQYLECRNSDGTWGQAFYQPKWTSTHYTLLALKNLEIAPSTTGILDVVLRVADRNIAGDGGLGTSANLKKSDVCVNGMFLNYACYFQVPERSITSVIDFLLTEKLDDGGFNCMRNRSGAQHSSLHSTLSVLEGIFEYRRAGHTYRLDDLQKAVVSSQDFILQHRFFKSDRTGKIINPDFLKMPYPPRWRYNVLRALDFFRSAKVAYDPRMDAALSAITARRRSDGKWPRQAALPGKVHFVMEPPRGPSLWNTLLALRVLRAYPQEPAADPTSAHI